jgi:hypothetical protein
MTINIVNINFLNKKKYNTNKKLRLIQKYKLGLKYPYIHHFILMIKLYQGTFK